MKDVSFPKNVVEYKMKMKKRGQAAIFVIIAVVIVVAGILIYLLVPGAKTILSGELVPASYLKNCFQENLQSNLDTLNKQGGYENPQGYADFNGNRVKYLCYTSQYYLPCKVQQPLIVRNYGNELERMTKAKVNECLANLKKEFEGRGYQVSVEGEATTRVGLVPDKINILITAPMTISKQSTQAFKNFEIDFPSKIYNLLMISTSIVGFESTYGNTDTDVFAAYYPNVNVDKIELEGGTTIFRVKDVTGNDEFTFASRSLVWPGGLGLRA